MTDRLDVWLYGTLVAHLDRTPDDRIELTWSNDAQDRWGLGTRVLSAKLPVGGPAFPGLVRNYLDGLLPEGNVRTNASMIVGVAPDDTFGLIRAHGRDTPGAALFVPADHGDPTREGRYEPVDIDEVAQRLRQADRYAPAEYGLATGESSTLPGMVPKITMHRAGAQWFACKDGAASTWILKRAFPADSGISDIVDTEVACLALAREIGLTSVDAEVLNLGAVRAIAVSRYDRPTEGTARRLHQEDLAQAIGLNTSDPQRKFQYGSRMPSLGHAADVLRLDGGNPDALLRLATFSYLVGNTDLHAKNISFLRLSDGRVLLSPAYDIAMHLHHPRDNRRFALDMNGKFQVTNIRIDDLVLEGISWGLPRRRAVRVVAETTTTLVQALDGLDRRLHAGVSDEAWTSVADRILSAESSMPAQSMTRAGRGGPASTATRRPSRASQGGNASGAAKRRGVGSTGSHPGQLAGE